MIKDNIFRILCIFGAISLAGCGGGGSSGGGAIAPQNASIGGTLTGINGSTVGLLLNGSDPIAVSSGSFTFDAKLQPGSTYTVTIPELQNNETCSISNGSGTVDQSGDNIGNVGVVCQAGAPNPYLGGSSSAYSINVTVSGLASGNTVTLVNGGLDPLTISANGISTFSSPLTNDFYQVTISTNAQAQSCNLVNATNVFPMSGPFTAVNVYLSCH